MQFTLNVMELDNHNLAQFSFLYIILYNLTLAFSTI